MTLDGAKALDWLVKAALPPLIVAVCGWVTSTSLKVSSLVERVAVTEAQMADTRADIKAIRGTLEKLLERNQGPQIKNQ
jgi:hypothetical protein